MNKLFLYKIAEPIQWRKKSFNKLCLNWTSICKKTRTLIYTPHVICKNEHKRIKDLNVKPSTI